MLYFSDVHRMLRLPRREAELAAGCNFAIGQVLPAAVSTIPTTLYSPKMRNYERVFRNVLISHYPWETEQKGPLTEDEKGEIADFLYDEFRGPLNFYRLRNDCDRRLRLERTRQRRVKGDL